MSTKSNAEKKPTPVKPKYVACKVCLAEIPESVAMSSEADDYTQHYCGIECYTQWRDETEKTKS